MRFITAWDARLSGRVMAKIISRPRVPKPKSSAARATSVA